MPPFLEGCLENPNSELRANSTNTANNLEQGLITWAGLVSVCRDLGTFVKQNKTQLRDYITTGPARLAEIPVSRCLGPGNFMYTRLPVQPGSFISPRQNRVRSGLPRLIASAIKQAGSPRVIPGWKSSRHTEAARLMQSGPKTLRPQRQRGRYPFGEAEWAIDPLPALLRGIFASTWFANSMGCELFVKRVQRTIEIDNAMNVGRRS